MGAIESIHFAPVAGGPMVELDAAHVIAGKGLAGDRYAVDAGYWTDDRVSRDITLIEGEVVAEAAAALGVDLPPGVTRRNVTTRDVRLNDLVGERFWLGDVLCEATHVCGPCRHLEEVTGLRLIRTLARRGGLRAKATTSGVIHPGDGIRVAERPGGDGMIVARDEG